VVPAAGDVGEAEGGGWVEVGEDVGGELEGQAGDDVAVEGTGGRGGVEPAPFMGREVGEQGQQGVAARVRRGQADKGVGGGGSGGGSGGGGGVAEVAGVHGKGHGTWGEGGEEWFGQSVMAEAEAWG
jgi:hypothetical protein